MFDQDECREQPDASCDPIHASGRRIVEQGISGETWLPSIALSGRKDLVIIGAGNSGRESYAWAVQAIAAGHPLRIKGFLDSRTTVLDGYDYDSRILGEVDTYEIEEIDVFIGAIGDPQDKRNYYSSTRERGGQFINLIHPSALLGKKYATWQWDCDGSVFSDNG